LHKDQHCKGTLIPYVTYAFAVAAIVVENDGTKYEVVAALLHDASESQGGEPLSKT
jgi:(p)ppGpp synthase/HD superfamily hydrolase